MRASMAAFLAAVDAIHSEQPAYRLGGKAADGTCDCIGLIIGALDRCGVKWPGIHGSNWAARNAMDGLQPVSGADGLATGDIVYKAKRPGEAGYRLPARYAACPDQNDYYHVGVVRSVSPLEIVHCTSPGGVKTDSRMGRWAYAGGLRLLDEIPLSPACHATLRYGSRGDEVALLQRKLRACGYTLAVDGLFGPMTREAVRSYQARQGLAADGVAGPLTWASLDKETEV